MSEEENKCPAEAEQTISDEKPEAVPDISPASEAEKASVPAEEDRFSAFTVPARPEEKKAAKGHINRRLRTLLLALGGTILLVGVLLLLLLLPPETDVENSSTPSDTTVTYPLYDRTDEAEDVAGIASILIQNSTGKYTLRYDKTEKGLLLDGYEDLALDSYSLTSLQEAAKVLNAYARIDNVTSLSDFGLESPAANVTITYQDQKQNQILIGSRVPSGEGYYTQLKGDDAVYMCSESVITFFLNSSASYVSTLLMSSPTVEEDDTDGKAVLRSLELTGTDRPQKLVLRRISNEDADEFAYYSYVITEPYYRGTSETAVTSLSTLTSLYASDAIVLHPTEAQRRQYGLETPRNVAKIVTCVETSDEDDSSNSASATVRYYNTITTTLSFGNQDENGNYYVMVKGIDVIFLVNASSVSPIVERTYENTVSDLLFLKDITSIQRVDIMINGKTTRFDLAHSEDEDNDKNLVVTFGGETGRTPEFRTLYQLMMGIRRYGTTDANPSGQPALRISLYSDKNTAYLVCDFYENGGSLYTVRTSEGECFTTKASGVTNFIKQVQNYCSGATVMEP